MFVVGALFTMSIKRKLVFKETDETEIAKKVWNEFKYLGRKEITFAIYNLKTGEFDMFKTNGSKVTNLKVSKQFDKDEFYFDIVAEDFKKIDSNKFQLSLSEDFSLLQYGSHKEIIPLAGLKFDMEQMKIIPNTTCTDGQNLAVTMQEYKQHFNLPSSQYQQGSPHKLIYFRCENGKRILRTCPANYEFNPSKKECTFTSKQISPKTLSLKLNSTKTSYQVEDYSGFLRTIHCENGVNRLGTRCNDTRCKNLNGVNFVGPIRHDELIYSSTSTLYSSAFNCINGRVVEERHCDSTPQFKTIKGVGLTEDSSKSFTYPKEHVTVSLKCEKISEKFFNDIDYPFKIPEYRAYEKDLKVKFKYNGVEYKQGKDSVAYIYEPRSFKLNGKTKTTNRAIIYKDKIYESTIDLPNIIDSDTINSRVVLQDAGFYFLIGSTVIDCIVFNKTSIPKSRFKTALDRIFTTVNGDFEHCPLPFKISNFNTFVTGGRYEYYNTADIYGIEKDHLIKWDHTKYIDHVKETYQIDITEKVQTLKSSAE